MISNTHLNWFYHLTRMWAGSPTTLALTSFPPQQLGYCHALCLCGSPDWHEARPEQSQIHKITALCLLRLPGTNSVIGGWAVFLPPESTKAQACHELETAGTLASLSTVNRVLHQIRQRFSHMCIWRTKDEAFKPWNTVPVVNHGPTYWRWYVLYCCCCLI